METSDTNDNHAKEMISELQETIRELELKIAKLQKDRGVYSAKSRLLSQELEQARSREDKQMTSIEQLIERQHELNVMLNRSHIMLSKAQNATAMLSVEFSELARALPNHSQGSDADEVEEVEDRVQRINDLFKRSGSLADEIAQTLQETTGESAQSETGVHATGSAAASAPPNTAARSQTEPERSDETVTAEASASAATEPDPQDAPRPREPVFQVVSDSEVEVEQASAEPELLESAAGPFARESEPAAHSAPQKAEEVTETEPPTDTADAEREELLDQLASEQEEADNNARRKRFWWNFR